MIQDVIDKLKALQDVLSKKFDIEKEIRNMPRALSTKTELVNRMKKSYIEKNNQYDETKARIRDLRARMEEAEGEREKYEQQMDLIKTQREYEALDKEIRDASEREQMLRKELQKEEKVLEEMSASLEREESLIKEQEDELEQEQEKIKSETEDRRHLLSDLEKEEKQLVPGLDEDLLFKFERIIRSKEGQGIVPLKKGVCSGCQMILPNQFVNEVRKGEDILFCPYCSKIVFYVGDDESTYAETEAEGLADVIDSFDDIEDDGLDLEDVLDEEPLDLREDDEDDVGEEEETLEADEESEEEEQTGNFDDEEDGFDDEDDDELDDDEDDEEEEDEEEEEDD